jgi:pimeloyl-ACP methyl ester carboxylesterase
MFVATPAEVRSGAFAAIAALDLSGVLGRLDLRVTVVAGGRDRLLPPWHARRIAQLIPGARLVTYEGTGHMVPLEEPERLSLLLADEAQRGDAAVSRHHFEHDTARGRSPRVPIGRSA